MTCFDDEDECLARMIESEFLFEVSGQFSEFHLAEAQPRTSGRRMEGGKDKHDESDRGISSHLVNDQGAPGQNPPHGSHPPPQVYPPACYHYPPGVYPPACYPGPSNHPGHRIEAMLAGGAAAAAYGAHHVGYGGGPFSYGSHGFWKHGKFKRRGGNFRHGKYGKHGKFRKHHGGKFRKWK